MIDRQRHLVAALQCPSVKTTEPGTHIGRGAAENRRDAKSALDREVGADRLAAKHDPEHVAAKERNTLPCGESPPAVNEDQAGAGSGDREPHAVGA